MSSQSLQKLAMVAGAKSLPSALYKNSWPGKVRRLAQIGYNLMKWALSANQLICVSGVEVPSTRGHVTLKEKATLSDILAGSCILAGGRLQAISTSLGLNTSTQLKAYLADADVLVVFGKTTSQSVVVHLCGDEAESTRYVSGYSIARKAFHHDDLQALLPEVLVQKQHSHGWQITQTTLAGISVNVKELSQQQLLTYMVVAMQPLTQLKQVARNNNTAPINQIFESQISQLKQHDVLAPFVIPILDIIATFQQQQAKCTEYAHCDYCLPNLLLNIASDNITLTGILDWERARNQVSLGYDALYLVCISYAEWVGCEVTEIYTQIWQSEYDPTLLKLLNSVKATFHLSDTDLGYLALELFIAHLANKLHDFDNWDTNKKAYWLLEPHHHAMQWLSKQPTSLINQELSA